MSKYWPCGICPLSMDFCRCEVTAMTEKVARLIETLRDLDTSDRIQVLEFLFKTFPHQWDFATMSEPLRRFYDPKSKRPQGPESVLPSD